MEYGRVFNFGTSVFAWQSLNCNPTLHPIEGISVPNIYPLYSRKLLFLNLADVLFVDTLPVMVSTSLQRSRLTNLNFQPRSHLYLVKFHKSEISISSPSRLPSSTRPRTLARKQHLQLGGEAGGRAKHPASVSGLDLPSPYSSGVRVAPKAPCISSIAQ